MTRACFAAFLLALSSCSVVSADIAPIPPPPALPPGRPESAPQGDGTAPTVIGMSRLFIGETHRNGVPSTVAWGDYGFDLDGDFPWSSPHPECRPQQHASPRDVFVPTPGLRDNAFGRKLLPFLKAGGGPVDVQSSIDKELTAHAWGLLFDLSGLGPGREYSKVDASLLVGELGGPETSWEVRPEYLSGSTPDTATIRFPNSYLVATSPTVSTWVSGDRVTLPIRLDVGYLSLNLLVHQAIITMDLDSTHTVATNGTIGGILDTDEFIAEARSLLGRYNPDLCTGQAVNSILNELRGASDIMVDGSSDPTTTCTGISIGLGFEGRAVTIAGVGSAALTVKSPCPPPP